MIQENQVAWEADKMGLIYGGCICLAGLPDWFFSGLARRGFWRACPTGFLAGIICLSGLDGRS